MSNKSQLVSVIMPVLSAKAYIKEAIESILNQSHKNIELIIVEDPSADLSKEEIESYKDPRIVYILNKSRTNLSAQLNRGLNMANGDYIARMDADDISERERIKTQLKYLLKHPDVSVVGSNLLLIDNKGKALGERKYPEHQADILKTMRTRNALAHPSVMFSKEDVVAAGGYGVNFKIYVEDYDLWSILLSREKTFYNIQKPLLRYRIHDKAIKFTDLKQMIRHIIKIKQKYYRRKPGWGFFNEIYFQLEKLLLILPKKTVFVLWKLINQI